MRGTHLKNNKLPRTANSCPLFGCPKCSNYSGQIFSFKRQNSCRGHRLHCSLQLHHRVDSFIESSLREIIDSNIFRLINLSLNFCETTIFNEVFLENLVAVH